MAIVSSLRHTRHWEAIQADNVAEITRRDVIGAGVCLPMVLFCAKPVVPVIGWNLAIACKRVEAGVGPLLVREELAARIAAGVDHLVPAAVRMLGFITISPLAAARGALAAVSGYAQAIAAVPDPPGADSWQALDCDFYGFTVAAVDPGGARVVVPGLGWAKHPRGGVGHQRRLMEEQLFDVALRAGLTPGQE
ncbi:MAG: hypothetical protein QM711_16855 [Micropruina sp.]|uniref:hypothetical protein n=1 Tax=Micropruina sp. TaxID=2737536 RepID=UPI0039E3099E